MGTRTVTPLQLGVSLTRFADLWNDRVLRALPNHILARLERRARALTATRTGRLRAGWQRIPGTAGRARLVNAVEYAAIVLPGRRRSKRGRMVGSPQQPDDAVLKGLAEVQAEAEAHIDRAFRDLDGV